jgi:gamma-glutamylaminecyclotransferase
MLVFVYGSLKSGQCNNMRFLGDQRYVGFARTFPAFRLYDCGRFPGLVEETDGVSVVGELWDVDDCCLTELDIFEAVRQGLYERRTIQLQEPLVEAQVYLFRHSVQGLPDCGESWGHDGQRRSKIAETQREGAEESEGKALST